MADKTVGNYFRPAPEAGDIEQHQGGGIRMPDGTYLIQNQPEHPPAEFYRAQPSAVGGLGGIVPSGAVGLVAAGLAAWGAWELWKEYKGEGGGKRRNTRGKKRYLNGKL